MCHRGEEIRLVHNMTQEPVSRRVTLRHVVLHYVAFRSVCSQYRRDAMQYVTPPNSSTTRLRSISYRLVYKT